MCFFEQGFCVGNLFFFIHKKALYGRAHECIRIVVVALPDLFLYSFLKLRRKSNRHSASCRIQVYTFRYEVDGSGFGDSRNAGSLSFLQDQRDRVRIETKAAPHHGRNNSANPALPSSKPPKQLD
jgi:hypothetical protein